jgi:hypothetical protein
MYSRNQTPTPSRTSPQGGRRGCLCKDGTYNSKCCNGDLQNQGIGNTTGQNSWIYNTKYSNSFNKKVNT